MPATRAESPRRGGARARARARAPARALAAWRAPAPRARLEAAVVVVVERGHVDLAPRVPVGLAEAQVGRRARQQPAPRRTKRTSTRPRGGSPSRSSTRARPPPRRRARPRRRLDDARLEPVHGRDETDARVRGRLRRVARSVAVATSSSATSPPKRGGGRAAREIERASRARAAHTHTLVVHVVAAVAAVVVFAVVVGRLLGPRARAPSAPARRQSPTTGAPPPRSASTSPGRVGEARRTRRQVVARSAALGLASTRAAVRGAARAVLVDRAVGRAEQPPAAPALAPRRGRARAAPPRREHARAERGHLARPPSFRGRRRRRARGCARAALKRALLGAVDVDEREARHVERRRGRARRDGQARRGREHGRVGDRPSTDAFATDDARGTGLRRARARCSWSPTESVYYPRRPRRCSSRAARARRRRPRAATAAAQHDALRAAAQRQPVHEPGKRTCGRRPRRARDGARFRGRERDVERRELARAAAARAARARAPRPGRRSAPRR